MSSIRQFIISHPWIITFVSAELLCLLVKSHHITIIAKKQSQRTKAEQGLMERGLLRSVLLELLLFVPISVILLLLSLSSFFISIMSKVSALQNPIVVNSLVGIVSYGFPFATLRTVLTRIALQTLKEFVLIASKSVGNQLKE